MKKSNDAATRAAQAAEQSLNFARQNAHLDQRAWLGTTKIIGGLPETGKQFSMKVHIKNGGRTFAKNVKVMCFTRTVDKDAAPPDFDAVETAESGEGQSVALIAPNGEYLSGVTSANPIQQDIVDKVRSGELRIFAFGKISYSDVLDAHIGQRFALYWIPRANTPCGNITMTPMIIEPLSVFECGAGSVPNFSLHCPTLRATRAPCRT